MIRTLPHVSPRRPLIQHNAALPHPDPTNRQPLPRPSSDPPGAEAQLRRFWKTVGIQPIPSTSPNPTSYLITLDGRSLKTPSGTKLEIPAERKVLALLIANEWENQKDVMKVSGLPMVGFVRLVHGTERGI